MKIIIINGPNLNLLAKREIKIYGGISFEGFYKQLVKDFAAVELSYYQTNVEGEIINKLQEVGFTYDGIILNAGGYTHTSVSIADAIAVLKTPVIEVHISHIHAREEYRKVSLLTKNCAGFISGLGLDSYRFALEHLISTNGKRNKH